MSIITITPELIQRATVFLRETDPALNALIDRIGPFKFAPETSGSHFDALARSIVFQQLSGRAANTIYARFLQLYSQAPPGPAEVNQTADEDLRSAGLSRAKAAYIKDLSARCISGELLIENLHEAPDSEVIERVTSVKGIGRWTAQMFLIFRLGRADVLSELDLGIRKAIQQLHGLDRLPAYREVEEIAQRWSPYRTVASWYLWRSLD